MTDSHPAAPAAPHQVAIEIPANLEAVYSNFALIAHSQSEMVIDFARMLPNMPQPRVCARIVMTPMSAKLLARALGDNLSRYEAQYGEIVVPTGLAEQLFKPPRPE